MDRPDTVRACRRRGVGRRSAGIRQPRGIGLPARRNRRRESPVVCRGNHSFRCERRRARRHFGFDGPAPSRALGRQSPALRVAVAGGPSRAADHRGSRWHTGHRCRKRIAAPGYPKPVERRARCKPPRWRRCRPLAARRCAASRHGRREHTLAGRGQSTGSGEHPHQSRVARAPSCGSRDRGRCARVDVRARHARRSGPQSPPSSRIPTPGGSLR